MTIDMTGKRVFISAGAAGIGRAMVDMFAQAGARIFTCDVDDQALAALKADFPDVEAIAADCADWSAVQDMFGQVQASLGGLDVLINNVGIAGPTARVEDIDLGDWQRTLDVNITGHFYCAKLGVPMLKAAGGGAMVNLSSAAGRFGFPLRLPYSSSKWAVVGFSKTLAIELGPDNIRVNAILPGLVEGERIDRVIDAKAKANKISFEEMRARLLANVSMGVGVTPYDIANMALYLCSDLGARVSGQAIAVDADTQQIA